MDDYDRAYQKILDVLRVCRALPDSLLKTYGEAAHTTITFRNPLYAEAVLKQLDALLLRVSELNAENVAFDETSLSRLATDALEAMVHVTTATKDQAPLTYQKLEKRLLDRVTP
jgi:hypothetical protein